MNRRRRIANADPALVGSTRMKKACLLVRNAKQEGIPIKTGVQRRVYANHALPGNSAALERQNARLSSVKKVILFHRVPGVKRFNVQVNRAPRHVMPVLVCLAKA